RSLHDALPIPELDAESLVELEEQEVDRTLRLPRLRVPALHVVDRSEESAVRTLLAVRDAQVQSRTRDPVVGRSRVLDRGRLSLEHRDVVDTSVERLVVAPGRSGLLLSTLGDVDLTRHVFLLWLVTVTGFLLRDRA